MFGCSDMLLTLTEQWSEVLANGSLIGCFSERDLDMVRCVCMCVSHSVVSDSS